MSLYKCIARASQQGHGAKHFFLVFDALAVDHRIDPADLRSQVCDRVVDDTFLAASLRRMKNVLPVLSIFVERVRCRRRRVKVCGGGAVRRHPHTPACLRNTKPTNFTLVVKSRMEHASLYDHVFAALVCNLVLAFLRIHYLTRSVTSAGWV